MRRCEVAEQNVIGKKMMNQEFNALGPANAECTMCLWLEKGYQEVQSLNEIEAYAIEILIHRRNLHVASADNVN